MADVRLDFYDLYAEKLPDVCMWCGAPSTVRHMRTFRWKPYWARSMPWMIQMAFMKRRRVPIPLCEQHKNHWTIHLIGFAGLALCVAPFILGLILMASNVDDDPQGPLTTLGAVLIAGGGILFLLWLITLMFYLGVTQLHVVEITDDAIVLKLISAKFAQAYREQTRGGFAP